MTPRTFQQVDDGLLAEKFTGHIIVHYMHGKKMAVQRPLPAERIPLIERRDGDRRTQATIPLDESAGGVHIRSRHDACEK
jgi:hypothetical protein